MQNVLAEARELQESAARVGFDWPDVRGAISKLREEIDELDRAAVRGCREEMCLELGDVFFSAVNVSRFIAADASETLHRANKKFEERFERLRIEVSRRGKRLEDCTLAELDSVWDQIKGPGGPAVGQ